MDYEYRDLGVMYISDNLSKRTQNKIRKKIEEIIDNAREELDAYLDEIGCECAMGAIIERK